MASHANKQADINRIADAIVDLVEQANGPVFFSEIDDKVPGFHSAADPAPYAMYSRGHEECVVWDGMTKAGFEALDKILRERRVAMQMVSLILPLALDMRIAESAVPPYVLLPIRAANVDTPSWAMRVSTKMQQMMLGAGKLGYRPLTPGEVGATADHFSS
jgi:hypothetical protein